MPRASSRAVLRLGSPPSGDRGRADRGSASSSSGVVVDLLRVRSEINAGRDSLTTLSVDQLDGDLVRTIERRHRAPRPGRPDRRSEPVPLGAQRRPGRRRAGRRAAHADGSRRRPRRRAPARPPAAIDVDLEEAAASRPPRLRLLATIADELDRIEAEVADIDLGEDRPARRPAGRRTVRAREPSSTGVPERFAEARTRVRALQRVLEGPTRYLVLAANNAEMRGGAGMPLSGRRPHDRGRRPRVRRVRADRQPVGGPDPGRTRARRVPATPTGSSAWGRAGCRPRCRRTSPPPARSSTP